MIAAVLFLGIVTLLSIEGWVLTALLLRKSERALRLALSLPLATFSNVLLVFAYTIGGVPLSAASIVIGHIVVILVTWLCARRSREHMLPAAEKGHRCWPRLRQCISSPLPFAAAVSCLLILLSALLYSFSHAVLLPSFQYDSATNWTMRSKISFFDERIAFDPDESRGMAKPQYPFLFHALQVTANAGQAVWSDRAANAILYLATLSSLGALFLLLTALTNPLQALVGVSLLASVPLLDLHLAQGYGDITLLQTLLLSLACLALWRETKQMWTLILSSLFVASGVWTKSEGVFFGLAPWTLLIAWSAIGDRSHRGALSRGGALAWILSVPWLLFAWWHGLGLTPHSSDTSVAFHPEGLSELVPALFARGSFGITWYVLPVAITLLLTASVRSHSLARRSMRFLLLWGALVFVEILFIYLATPNVTFLLNAQAFYRQMLVPATLLILSCVTIYSPSHQRKASSCEL